ncbi:MAG: oligosaccharide flippase family protein [Pseudomonadota bacterium]
MIRRLLKHGSTLLGGSGVALAASFLQTLLIARILGPVDFGVWAGIQAFCSVVASLLTFRTSEPVTRFLVEYRQHQDNHAIALLLGTALAVDAATQLLAILAIILIAPWVAGNLPGGVAAASLYPLFAWALLRSLFDHTWFSVARDLGRYRAIATLNAAFPVLRLALIATVITLSGGLTLPILAMLMVIVGLIQMGVTGFFLWRAIESGYSLGLAALFQGDLLRRQALLAPFWSFMQATFLWSLFTALVKEGDVLILGGLRPAEEVGWYRLAKSLVATLQQIADLLGQVIYQDFSEQVVARNGAALRRTARLLLQTWLPGVVVMTGIGMGLAHPVIPAVFGANYQPAAEVFAVLLMGSGVVTMLFWVRPLALAFELHWYNFQVIVWSSLFFVGLDGVLIQRWGIRGAAAAFALIAAAGPLALLPPVWRRLRQVLP